MSQWTNTFLASSEEQSLDPITFAISRFSLNICCSFDSVHPLYLIETGIHKQLVNYISLSSELAC